MVVSRQYSILYVLVVSRYPKEVVVVVAGQYVQIDHNSSLLQLQRMQHTELECVVLDVFMENQYKS